MRLIGGIYWVLAADRLNQAQPANQEDTEFVLQLMREVDVAKMENTGIFIDAGDWERLLRMIPNVQQRQPPRMPEIKKLEQQSAFVPRATGALHLVDATGALHLVDGAGEPEAPSDVKPVSQ
jgi:hypothetical protein